MSDAADDLPRFYTAKQAWPVEVRRYVHWLCYERQREIQGTDAGVLEWLFRGRGAVRSMASASEIWPVLVREAKVWDDQERAKAQRPGERGNV